MIFQLLLLIVFTSGLSIFWSIFLDDHPKLKEKLNRRGKLFVCGTCQIFWLSLLVAIFFNPFADLQLPLRFTLHPTISSMFVFLFAWQLIALVSLGIFRLFHKEI